MQNAVGIVLACAGLFAAVTGLFGVGVGMVAGGLLLLILSAAFLIDVDGG